MKLTVLCPHFAPDPAPTGEVITRIVHELADRGHEVHVVTALPWYTHHRIEEGWGGRLVRREVTPWGSITRNPYGLESALLKISNDKEVLEVANRATQHLYIVNPIKAFEARAQGLFETHPPIVDRVNRLRELTGSQPLDAEHPDPAGLD